MDSAVGPHAKAFEEEFAQKVQVPYGVALSSGTAALHLALQLLDVKPGDEVITSPLTFAATANAITCVDVSPKTWTIDPELLASHRREVVQDGWLKVIGRAVAVNHV